MRDLSDTETAIHDGAIAFAKANKKSIAAELTDLTAFPQDPSPVSVFMAGSPGAGKTEASKALIQEIEGIPPIRIDPDELRDRFPDYDGANSWLFQRAIAILVDRIHDIVLKNGQNFVLDGTLSSLDKARSNVTRSLKRGRHVQILYVYQEPALAWEFVRAREKVEGRRILPKTFIEQYFAARRVVNTLKHDFGKEISVDLILKDRDNSNKIYKDNIDKIDNHVKEKYTEADIERLLGQ